MRAVQETQPQHLPADVDFAALVRCFGRGMLLSVGFFVLLLTAAFWRGFWWLLMAAACGVYGGWLVLWTVKPGVWLRCASTLGVVVGGFAGTLATLGLTRAFTVPHPLFLTNAIWFPALVFSLVVALGRRTRRRLENKEHTIM